MSAITTHVLNTSTGRPASDVPVRLEIQNPEQGWLLVGRGTTDADGRLRDLMPRDTVLIEGIYRLVFDTAAYFELQSVEGFYPEVIVVFSVRNPVQHYHVPLLVSPFGYSTYRGS